MKEIETRIAKSFHQGNSKNWNGGVFPNPSTQTVLQAISGWLSGNSLFFPIAHERRISFYRDPSLKRTQTFNRAQIGADHVRLDARGHCSSLRFGHAVLGKHWRSTHLRPENRVVLNSQCNGTWQGWQSANFVILVAKIIWVKYGWRRTMNCYWFA